MRARIVGKLDERRIGWLLAGFFLALAIPAVLLIAQAYGQLKWESLSRNRLLAEDFAARVDGDLRAALAAEEARSFGDYSFLVVEGDAAANFVQRSPLSAFPVASAVPGVLGYFQVDAAGKLTTPLLPDGVVDAASYGISSDEQGARLALARTLGDVLAQNRLAQRTQFTADDAAASPQAPAAFAESNEAARRASPNPPAAEESQSVPPALDEVVVTGSRVVRRDQNAAVPVPAIEAGQGAEASETPAAGPAGTAAAQVEFDRLSARSGASRADDLAKAADSTAAGAVGAERARTNALADSPSPVAAAAAPAELRQKRSEQGLEANVVGERAQDDLGSAVTAPAAKLEVSVRTFESELDPFEIGLLGTGHLVMFRNVWRDGRRYVQGALLDREQFLARAVRAPFAASSLAAMSDLSVSYDGQTIGVVRAAAAGNYESRPRELVGEPLYRTRLSPPFGAMELAFNVSALPRAPGTLLLVWVSVTLAAVLCGGFLLMYRFAAGQLKLARQQQDFVSAVSHELKTPLTSIRMYGEMLKAGWADEAKKQTYYDYIHSESERLSRLIENVLQLARLTRNSQHFDMKRASAAELLDMVRSKVDTQIQRAGFALEIRNEAPADAEISVDGDAFAQVFINLVDNALKFSAGAERKIVEIASRRESDGRLLFTVRDFGPGIPKGQMKKIFELFYRPENELTRETVGTGIGLALVRQLAVAMGGRVDVRNCEPGAEFRLSFPPAPH